ncbi:MAG: hypothetical protein PVG86_09375 [Desulfobacterales bacterium]
MNGQVAKDILELGTFSNSFLLLISGIMIGSGILGGLVNFFSLENHKSPAWKALLGYCLLGIVAALTVPLFLNMISSDLLIDAPKKPVNLFIFNGICLLFSVFSCRLKENLFNKRFQGTGIMNKDPIYADPAEIEGYLKIGRRMASKDRLDRAGISQSELKILQVMASGNHVHRSLVDLLKDPELAKEHVNETLSSVMAKGWVEQKLNKENKLRLYLTPKGKRIIDKFYN